MDRASDLSDYSCFEDILKVSSRTKSKLHLSSESLARVLEDRDVLDGAGDYVRVH